MESLFKSEDREYRSPLLRRHVPQGSGRDIVDTFLYRPWTLWLEKQTQRQEKEMDFLVGQILTRVKFEAACRDEGDTYAMFKCMVIKIDDEEVQKKQQEIKAEVFESREAPTAQEQAEIFRQALENWGIRGNAVAVTEKYVAGHLRLVALKKRSLHKNKKG